MPSGEQQRGEDERPGRRGRARRPGRAATAGRPARATPTGPARRSGSRVWTTTSGQPQPDQPGDGDGQRRRPRASQPSGSGGLVRLRPAAGRRASRETTPPTARKRARRMVGARAERRKARRGSPPARPHAERLRPGAPCRDAGPDAVRCAVSCPRDGPGRPPRAPRRRRGGGAGGLAGGGAGSPAAAVGGGGRGGGGGAYCCGGWPGWPGSRPAARLLTEPGAGWLAHCAALASPPGSAGRLRSSGSSARTANTRIAAAVSVPSSAQIEKSTLKVSIQANSVSTKPSAASPTVIQDRGKPSLGR